jgi:CubicO group peptidase (beta-lactamase class C family)
MQADWAPVRRILSDGVRDGVFSAAALEVSLRGRPAFQGTAGHLTVEPGAPAADAGTVFDLASLTKPLATVSCLMGLVQEGRLGLGDPVRAHLPAFAEGPEGAVRRGVTLAHLLAHVSGLPACRSYFEAVGPPVVQGAPGPDPRAAVLDRVCAEPLEAAPGARAVYSDLGFILLGEVVARAEGVPLETVFRRRVAEPLGLADTGFNPGNAVPGPFGARAAATSGSAWRGGRLQGVVQDDNAYALGGVAGHAGLFGPAGDVGRWARALLDAWQGRSAWRQRAVVAAFLEPAERVPGSSWVLGLDTPTPPSSAGPWMGPRAVGHLGYTGTSVWIDPDREWVVVLLTNRVLTDPAGDRIRRFRPLLHGAVGQALFGGPAPAPGGCSAPGPSSSRPAGS